MEGGCGRFRAGPRARAGHIARARGSTGPRARTGHIARTCPGADALLIHLIIEGAADLIFHDNALLGDRVALLFAEAAAVGAAGLARIAGPVAAGGAVRRAGEDLAALARAVAAGRGLAYGEHAVAHSITGAAAVRTAGCLVLDIGALAVAAHCTVGSAGGRRLVYVAGAVTAYGNGQADEVAGVTVGAAAVGTAGGGRFVTGALAVTAHRAVLGASCQVLALLARPVVAHGVGEAQELDRIAGGFGRAGAVDAAGSAGLSAGALAVAALRAIAGAVTGVLFTGAGAVAAAAEVERAVSRACGTVLAALAQVVTADGAGVFVAQEADGDGGVVHEALPVLAIEHTAHLELDVRSGAHGISGKGDVLEPGVLDVVLERLRLVFVDPVGQGREREAQRVGAKAGPRDAHADVQCIHGALQLGEATGEGRRGPRGQ